MQKHRSNEEWKNTGSHHFRIHQKVAFTKNTRTYHNWLCMMILPNWSSHTFPIKSGFAWNSSTWRLFSLHQFHIWYAKWFFSITRIKKHLLRRKFHVVSLPSSWCIDYKLTSIVFLLFLIWSHYMRWFSAVCSTVFVQLKYHAEKLMGI